MTIVTSNVFQVQIEFPNKKLLHLGYYEDENTVREIASISEKALKNIPLPLKTTVSRSVLPLKPDDEAFQLIYVNGREKSIIHGQNTLDNEKIRIKTLIKHTFKNSRF